MPNFVFKKLECESFTYRRLIKEVPRLAKNWKRRTLDNFLRKLQTTGSIYINYT